MRSLFGVGELDTGRTDRKPTACRARNDGQAFGSPDTERRSKAHVRGES